MCPKLNFDVQSGNEKNLGCNMDTVVHWFVGPLFVS